MICRMCLNKTSDALGIFEQDCAQYEIAATISRHFWFEPTKDDPISNMICLACWTKIDDFHNYFLSVEEAQLKQAELLQIKEEATLQNAVFLKVEDNSAEFHETELLETSVNESDKVKKDEFFDDCSLDEDSELFADAMVDNGDDGDSCTSSDDEPLAKKLQSIRKFKLPKEVKDFPQLSDSIKSENSTNNSISNEPLNHDKAKTSNTAVTPTKAKRGRKKESDKINTVPKPESTEYRKQSRQFDDEIAQFMKLKCDLCLANYRTFAEIKRHYRSVHNQKGYVICCTTRKFFKRVFLYEHIQKHKNPDHFKCHFCEKVYCSASVLRSHLTTHDSTFEKLYQCDKCPRRFARLSILNHHKIIHIPKEQHTFSCDVCGKSFPTKNTMETHRKAVHEKAYAKMCHICAKVICGKTLFAKHQLEHIGITDPRVKCDICGTWLKNEFRLKIHTKKHHTDETNGEHICNICGKISPSSVGLKSHIRYVHSAVRKFQCSVCEKGFKTSLNLKEHMTTHTGDILYTCPHCPKTFNSSANMHSHRKKVHRDEWEESRRNRGLPIQTKSANNKKEKAQVIVPVAENTETQQIEVIENFVSHDDIRLDSLL